jgi:transposase
MGRLGAKSCDVAAARRGQIIQRVLVDGWSPAEAAAAFDVEERQIVRWLAAYRRRGMASLHDEAASEGAPGRWARRLRMILAPVFTELRGEFPQREPAPCVTLRRRDDASAGR